MKSIDLYYIAELILDLEVSLYYLKSFLIIFYIYIYISIDQLTRALNGRVEW